MINCEPGRSLTLARVYRINLLIKGNIKGGVLSPLVSHVALL